MINITTHTKTMLADLQTPLSLYLKLRDICPESALLEGYDYHSEEDSYSFIGFDPIASFKIEDKNVITSIQEKSEVNPISKPIDEIFNAFTQQFNILGDNPINVNGFFGYTAYDVVNHLFDPEHKTLSYKKNNGIDVPDIYYVLYRFILVINQFKNELTIVENVFDHEKSQMADIEVLLQSNNFALYPFTTTTEEESSITDNEYLAAIQEGIEHCLAEDISQIVLSRRFDQGFAGDDFNVYRTLRSINPSPYLFYFNFGDFSVFGSSPETHCKISNGRVYVDPIAGTYRRTHDFEQDRKLAEQLLLDEKENDEHEMLVNLAIEDLQKSCTEVTIESHKKIKYFSHVIHLVSRVGGKLMENKLGYSVFLETFPAGTLSGAAKPTAIELIDRIEPQNRGIYGGCIGYIGFNGDINQAITIRSFINQNGVLHYQAGAGIIGKSKPENELNEISNKLAALRSAIDSANHLNKEN